MAAFLDDTMNHLIEEKFAKRTAGAAFGVAGSMSNAEIASSYGDQVALDIIRLAVNVDFSKGNALKTQQAWANDVTLVKDAIKAFYDKLDAASAPQSTPGAGQGGQPAGPGGAHSSPPP